MKVGLDVAQIWLDGNETLVNTIDRDGNMLPINVANGHALTHDPLVVLVSFLFFSFQISSSNEFWRVFVEYWPSLVGSIM